MNIMFQLENIELYHREQERKHRKNRRAKRAKIREKLTENHIDELYDAEMDWIYSNYWDIYAE